MNTKALFAAGIGLLGTLMAPSYAVANDHTDHSFDIRPDGRGNRTTRMSQRARVSGAVVAGNGINYHNGPVMHSITLYYIYYGTWTSSQTNLLAQFGSHIGGSPYFNINTTYGDSTGNVPNAVTLGPSYTFPTTSLGTALSDNNIGSLVATAIASGKLGPADTNGVYMVLTGPGITETSGFLNKYCGWHSWGTLNGVPLQFAFIGNPAGPQLGNCAAQTSSPNGDAGVDAMVSIMAHELEESATDPQGNGWYDSAGDENGDKCAWTFGTTYTANGAHANMNLGGQDYLIQQNWLNANGGLCVLSYVTTPDFGVSVSAPQTVAASGKASFTLTATPTNGFSGQVSWALGALPSSFTANLGSTSGNLVTLTATAGANQPAGTYLIPVTATSGSLTHTINATLVVSAPAFTLSISPASQAITRPGSGSASVTYTVTAGAVGAFNSNVALSVSGSRTGVTYTVSPASIAPGQTATVTATATSAATQRTRSFTVLATSGGITRLVSANLSVQ